MRSEGQRANHVCGAIGKRRAHNSKQNANLSQHTVKRVQTLFNRTPPPHKKKGFQKEDYQVNFKALSLKLDFQLSKLSTSMWRSVHSPHSKWTSLCFGLPNTLGGRHWPGAMLSVRTGRLSEHCRRNTRENHLLVTANLLHLYIPGKSHPHL